MTFQANMVDGGSDHILRNNLFFPYFVGKGDIVVKKDQSCSVRAEQIKTCCNRVYGF